MSGPEPFKLYAGHPALELVNTLDLRFSDQAEDLIPTYKDTCSVSPRNWGY